ncbi:MAG: class I SAM-dependent methyltransferase [Cyanobacteria bacterium P01_D01_bin.56]
MSDAGGKLQSHLYDYLLSVSLREPEILAQLRQETEQHPEGDMQISPEQGQFMTLLLRLVGAKKVLEIGTFTGYSALWMALALPSDGTLVACDVSEEYTAMARRYWQAAGVANKITLHLAPAVETLDNLISTGNSGTFDFVFIDADKTSYHDYYEKALELLRPGRLIAIDNVLWGGAVANLDELDDNTVALRNLNQALYMDDRIELSMLPIADGLTLALKHS